MFSCGPRASGSARDQNGRVSRKRATSVTALWERARSGDLRGAALGAREGLASKLSASAATRAELHLVAAACAMRQGEHADAVRELDAARNAATTAPADAGLVLRVDTWRAELAYFQGRYSAASEIIDRVIEPLERLGDHAQVAFALRVRIAVQLARGDYGSIDDTARAALEAAKAGADDYVLVQVLNILGAVAFDRATSKLAQPHARAHLSALDPRDTAPMESDARAALQLFQQARRVANRAGYEFAAWYVAGNIERLEILLGHPERAVRAIRKRMSVLQKRGATYDEIVTRSNLGWALRNLGRHREALHELDVALQLARKTGTFNVLLEFLYYDRSIVLDALHDLPGARASYRRYLRLSTARNRNAPPSSGPPATTSPRPLEPFFLKRADRYIVEHIVEPITVGMLADYCRVSMRTLQKAFIDFRGLTPVAYTRNLRLDHAHRALAAQAASVGEVAARFGFGSPTTFALEYRKRFGVAPSRTRAAARAVKDGSPA